MVIQTTPHTELAIAPDIPGAEQPQKLKPDKNGLGVFAKILDGLAGRGLLRKTGTGERPSGAENPANVPLAETAETDELAPLTAGKGKTARGGKAVTKNAAALTGTKKPQKEGETGPETPVTGLSEQEKNLLFTAGLIAGLQGEPAGKTGGPAAKAADSASRRQGGDAEGLSVAAGADAGEEAGEVLTGQIPAGTENGAAKQPLQPEAAAFAAGGPVENQKNAPEKAPFGFGEAGASAAAAGEAASRELPQSAEAKKAVPGEKDGKGRLEEARGRDRKKSVAVEVQDFRSADGKTEIHKTAGIEPAARAEAGRNGGDTLKDLVLELRLPNQGQDSSSAVSSWETRAGQSFEDMLARELHQNFNNDIVRHASIALRDGGQGTIRLALKPESLGNVKIRLEMAENKITGHIFVESEEALRAFEREIASLEKAFLDSGFEAANLEMSLAADGREAQQQWQGTEASRILPGTVAASRYDAAAEWMEPFALDVYQQGTRAVNVLA